MITATQPSAGTLKAQYNFGYIWLISIVAALGGLLFGYDWVVIGGAKPFFERYFQIADNAQLSGWANSCALIGCLVGALVAGALSDKFGRKKLLLLSAFLFAGTSLGNALAPTFWIFVTWRMLGGVAIGLASNLSPMYIAEIAPAQMRGKLVSINQLTVVIGILLAQFINWSLVRHLPAGATDAFIQNSWYGQAGWRWMFGITAVPSLLFFLGMFFVPESPRWLVKNGKFSGAKTVLQRIGGSDYSVAALGEIGDTLKDEIEKVNFRDLLEPKMRRVLLLGVVLAVFQQWCGINVIFNYAEDIFRSAGYDISSVLKNIAWTGSVNMAFTFVALGVVDRGGRRPLMLFGAAALAVIYTVLGFCYHEGMHGLPLLLLVLAAIAAYSMSLAPVTWVVISEIFPNRIRGAAMAVAVAALWGACFILTDTFPLLNAKLGSAGTFWLYAAICVAGYLFLWKKLPETRGKSLEQIEKELVD
ncbi:MAG TPA: sugar porter family MFS transporter [Verrucomicrobiae bacterium]|nr:sugar porter family MFS transporter [Verrucomicrobiae bacterium]